MGAAHPGAGVGETTSTPTSPQHTCSLTVDEELPSVCAGAASLTCYLRRVGFPGLVCEACLLGRRIPVGPVFWVQNAKPAAACAYLGPISMDAMRNKHLANLDPKTLETAQERVGRA